MISEQDKTGQPLRVGLVGAGHWAASVHAPALAATHGFELAAVWGRQHERSQFLANEYGASAPATIEDLIGQVDAVSFAVPPDVQLPAALQAAAQGKHLILEKPVGRTTRDVTELRILVDRQQVNTVTHYTRLFDPAIIDFIRTQQNDPSDAVFVNQNGAILPGSPFASSAWRHQSDGPVLDLGPHAVSVVILAQGEPLTVTGESEADVVTAHICHSSGVQSTLVLALNASEEDESYQRSTAHRGDGIRPSLSASVATYQAALATLTRPPQNNIAAAVRELSFSEKVARTLEAITTAMATGEVVEIDPIHSPQTLSTGHLA